MGNDELISDERWIQETLDSDEEVKTSKQRMLSKALNDKGEIPRTFRMSTHSPLQPLAENSKELKFARKTLSTTRSKKQLQGLYEAIPEEAALIKTSGSTMTIKYTGQDDTVLHKSEVALFGTPSQPKIPLIQFAARETVIKHHGKIQRHMNAHQKEQSAKLKGEKSIRKRPSDSPTNPNLSNLLKVNRTKVLPKRKFVQSPRKGATGEKKQKTTTPPDSPFEDEDVELEPSQQRILSNNEDSDYNPQEDPSIQVIAAHKNPRRSNRPTKKPEKYGQSETLTTDEDTEDSENSHPRKRFTGIANYQATNTALDDNQQSPAQQAEEQDESQAQQEDELQAKTLPPPHEDYDDTVFPQQATAQQSPKTTTVDEDNEERELDPHEL